MGAVTVEQVEKIIRDNQAAEEQGTVYHNEVTKILKKFSGKKPTKHIANEFQKLHPELAVNWRAEYGMYHLDFWGNSTGRGYQNRYSMLIGYDTHPIVDLDKWQEYDACYGNAAEERNQQRKRLLNDKAWLAKITEAINQFNTAHANLNALVVEHIEVPDSYDIEKLAPLYTTYVRR